MQLGKVIASVVAKAFRQWLVRALYVCEASGIVLGAGDRGVTCNRSLFLLDYPQGGDEQGGGSCEAVVPDVDRPARWQIIVHAVKKIQLDRELERGREAGGRLPRTDGVML